MARTIVTYSGKDIYDMSTAVTEGLSDINTIFGAVETAFANTGIGGEAGDKLKSPIADASEKMKTLTDDLTSIDTTLQEEMKTDNEVKQQVDDIYSEPIVL